MPAFSLYDPDGQLLESPSLTGKPLLVAFICNHCPYVQHIADGLSAFANDYQARGLAVIAINSNDYHQYPADAPDRMREEALARHYTFPYLVDETQLVARAFMAACTPDFFLYDRNHRLAYRGQFDGSRPGNDTPVTGADLRAAADAVLDGTTPDPDQTPSLGCNIKWRT
jgi:thiol-disulfide isomerase/thioredoxin